MIQLLEIKDRKIFCMRGRILECSILRPAILEGAPQIENCYRQAAEAFLGWMQKERLNAVCAVGGVNTNREAERKSRLHSQPEFWCFDGKGQLIDGRYLSVVLQVSGRGEDGVIRQFEQRRVWDAEKGILCPLECFLPRKIAKKYQKWTYSLENGFILVYKNNRKNKKKPAQPVKLVKK